MSHGEKPLKKIIYIYAFHSRQAGLAVKPLALWVKDDITRKATGPQLPKRTHWFSQSTAISPNQV